MFDGEIQLMPHGDAPIGQGSDQADQIVWGQVEPPNRFRLMAFDVRDSQSWTDEPLAPSVFSPLYGKLADRFGVTWIIDVMADPATWA